MTTPTTPCGVGRAYLPSSLQPLDTPLFDLTVRDFSTSNSYDVAVGLIKALQGVITNLFHRLAKVAFLARVRS